MTREEAIADIRDNIKPVVGGISLDMAIKSLEQEPCEDCVSRQAVLNTLNNMDKVLDEDRTVENYKDLLKECYEVLPSVTPQEPCSNCCNGNQIEKAKLCQKSYLAGMEHKQEPKTGHWIDFGAIEPWFMCSECNERVFGSYKKYCPNCGSKMEGENKG